MNREIKFRGKKVNNDEWMYGYYYVKTHRHIILMDFGDYYARAEVDPKSVGQYTGLKDKNEKEIYKNDLVKRFEEDKGILVVFNDGAFCFDEATSWIFCQDLAGRHYEVIGNTTDNPKLLEEN